MNLVLHHSLRGIFHALAIGEGSFEWVREEKEDEEEEAEVPTVLLRRTCLPRAATVNAPSSARASARSSRRIDARTHALTPRRR